MNLHPNDQLDALRSLVFGEVERWNASHPHPLRSHHEKAAVHVTQVYADQRGVPTYTVTVICALAGSAQLAFHGSDLGTVAEHARLTLEHRISAELHRRADLLRDSALEERFGIAV